MVLLSQRHLDVIQNGLVKRSAFGQTDVTHGCHQILGLDVFVAFDFKALNRWPLVHSDNQRVTITPKFDIVEQALDVQGPNRFLHTDIVDRIANVNWQVIEHRAFGNSLQSFDTHITNDEVIGIRNNWQQETAGCYPDPYYTPALTQVFVAFCHGCALSQDSRYIVIEGITHQQDQRRDAELLPDHLRPLRHRAALE